MNKLAERKVKKGERGSILAMSTIGMLSVLLAVGLGVDISHFYLVKGELQNAADASALAAASAINSKPSGIVEGTNRAVRAMNSYEFNNTRIQISANNVTWSKNLESGYMSVADASSPEQARDMRFVKIVTPDSLRKELPPNRI